MLEIRPICENCSKLLPNESKEAMICSFECTFCVDCVTNILDNVCPNCGGGFALRPSRPTKDFTKYNLTNYPATTKEVYKPVNMEKFKVLYEANAGIDPRER